MPLKKDLGQWISHFKDSDAPQFKGKSEEERKNMALAAYRAKYGSLNEAYTQATNNELASYIGILQNQIGAEKDPKKLAMLKQDLEDVKNELNSRKQVKKEDATAEEEDKFHRDLDKLVHKTFGHSSDEKKKEMKEQAKPDFLDIDKDSDKKEAMKKAVKDAAIKKAMKKVSEIVVTDDAEKAEDIANKTGEEVKVVKKGTIKEGREYDYEGKMAQAQLLSIVKNARDLFNMIGKDTQLKSWVQSKLTKAEDYLDSVRTYLEGESISTTVPAMFENERIKDDEGSSLNIGDVVKGGDGKIYQVTFSASEGKPSLVPFDLKKRKIVTLRDKIYFDSDSTVPKRLNKVMDYSATKGGFMN